MFHDAAGGGNYTSLMNRLQGEIDFSDHLEQGTALLIGKIERRPTVMFANKDQATDQQNSKLDTGVTFVRILMPVTKKLKDKSAGT